MFLQRIWGACLLLILVFAVSGCGLKYDLYLPEDENNTQNQAKQADPEAYADAVYADSFMDDDSDTSIDNSADPDDNDAAQNEN